MCCSHMNCIYFILQPTFPDFAIYELLDQHRIMDPNCMDSFKKLKSFLDRFEVYIYMIFLYFPIFYIFTKQSCET